MTVHATSPQFKENARRALADAGLQRAMSHVRGAFVNKRATAVADLPEFDALRDSARDIKDHTLQHLDLYLEAYETAVTAAGGTVHFARDAAEATKIIVDLCKRHGARTITKGKSMVSEEIGLNAVIEAAGLTPIETDLGEYIVQIRGEVPSHIIAPAVHLTRQQVEDDFRRHHTHLAPDRDLAEPVQLLTEARTILRERFLAADVGITGANFLVAETGTSVIVTNEGNGDLTQLLPKVHIVLATLEKLVPTLEDLAQMLRVLARSATGQEMSVYTSLSTGPRRPGDPDGPEHYHVVLLDNGRSSIVGSSFGEVLRCIRCGACMNHCPVYHSLGGHAYGWIYPGPIGAVLTPALIGVDKAGHLPNASTFCGRCEEVCPVRIPLPRLMRHWREREFERHLQPAPIRSGLAFWGFFARRPALYRAATGAAMRLLALLGRGKGRFAALPFAGGWTAFRDLPAPQGSTFQSAWAARKRGSPAMSEARADILATIRRSLGVTGREQTRRDSVRSRLAGHPRGPVPARGQVPPAERLVLFKARAEKSAATVAVVADAAAVPAEIARFLRDANLPASLRRGADPRLAAMPWAATALTVSAGPSDGSDLNAVSHAAGGVAETGTLVLLSGPDNPTSLNFLPDTHFVVLRAGDIAGDLETVLDRLPREGGPAALPRSINLVTGPSRSADIEQTLILGAHGPRRTHIVVVQEPDLASVP